VSSLLRCIRSSAHRCGFDRENGIIGEGRFACARYATTELNGKEPAGAIAAVSGLSPSARPLPCPLLATWHASMYSLSRARARHQT
jgi:hypothetical protein